MFKAIFQKGANANVSRVVVLLIDVFLVVQAFLIAYIINFNFNLSFQKFGFFSQVLMVAGIATICFLIVGSYKGTVRQTGAKDATNVFYGVSLLFIALFSYSIHYCRKKGCPTWGKFFIFDWITDLI